MEAVVMMVYMLVIIIVFFIFAFGFYIAYDYMSLKTELEDNLEKSNKDINYNFDVSAKALQYVYDETTDNKKDITTNTDAINSLSSYARNTSNLMEDNVKNINNRFVAFDANLDKYFNFFADGKDISTNTGNNKIYNYVATNPNSLNMELVQRTTAIGGLTVLSDVNKELKICKQLTDTAKTNKCIIADIDSTGADFTIRPDGETGTGNILFKDKNNAVLAKFDVANKKVQFIGGTAQVPNILANFDITANKIYFGGDTDANASMSIDRSGIILNTGKAIKLKSGATEKSIDFATYNTLTGIIPATYKITKTGTDVIFELILTFAYTINIKTGSKILLNIPSNVTTPLLPLLLSTAGRFSSSDATFSSANINFTNFSLNITGDLNITANTTITYTTNNIDISGLSTSEKSAIQTMPTPVSINAVLYLAP